MSDDFEFKNACEQIYVLSVITHALGIVVIILMKWRPFKASYLGQMIHVIQGLFNIYLVNITVDAYTVFLERNESLDKSEKLTNLAAHPCKFNYFLIALIITVVLNLFLVADDNLNLLSKYHYWALFEMLVFFSYIFVIFIHLLCQQISPFKVYMYYIRKVFQRTHNVS